MVIVVGLEFRIMKFVSNVIKKIILQTILNSFVVFILDSFLLKILKYIQPFLHSHKDS
jgi:hypothetical protein